MLVPSVGIERWYCVLLLQCEPVTDSCEFRNFPLPPPVDLSMRLSFFAAHASEAVRPCMFPKIALVWFVGVTVLWPYGIHAQTGEPDTVVRIPVSRDTWLSSVPQEQSGSNGGATRLKLKSYQELSLVDIDPAMLQGRTIEQATLVVRASPETTLGRVTVGSISAEWTEGSETNYRAQPGVSTFAHRQHPDVPWSYAGSDLCSVVLGLGNSTWHSADASPPDAEGWHKIDVDPSVVAMRIAGLSYGFLIFDDTGSEWKRDGEKFTVSPFPNRFLFSRDQGPRHAPYFEFKLGSEDRSPPGTPTLLESSVGELPRGEAWLSWVTPGDEGSAGTLGFTVSLNGTPLPRYLIPLAGTPGQRVHMHLRDIAWNQNQPLDVEIAAIDAAGNVGSALQGKITISNRRTDDSLKIALQATAGEQPLSQPKAGKPAIAKLGDANVAVIDELDKVQPITGEMVPKQPAGYLSANHLWNAERRLISLSGARSECIAFQVLIGGAAKEVTASLDFDGAASTATVRLGTYAYVSTERGPMPDPIVPLAGSWSVPAASENIAGQKYGSMHVEVELPDDLPAGIYTGTFKLRSKEGECNLPIELNVWSFQVPDRLTYLPEMNSYGLPANELDYYRLAHQHRTVLNRLPYSHRGTVDDGCAPIWDGKEFDWSAWDKRFGPLFDGTAFQDLPRSGVPIECFYLPLFENWPTPIEPHYNGGYWADRELSEEYRSQFVLASQRIAEHLRQRSWDDTLFHFYLNGKNDFKRAGWSRSTSPWILDEPAHFQDFWALRWFGDAFHEGINRVPGPKALVFRTDISRPEWQRDVLDGVIDYNVVGSAFRKYRRLVDDRRRKFGEIVIEYGTTNRPDQANVQPVAWCIDTWSLGIDGVLPWQTIGTAESWKKGDELSLFYPNRSGKGGPVPSVRLKAYRRGQQDVEYLALLAQSLGKPRWEVGQMAREALHLSADRATREGTANRGSEDAGRMGYSGLLPQEFDAFRKQVAAQIPPVPPSIDAAITHRVPPPRTFIERR